MNFSYGVLSVLRSIAFQVVLICPLVVLETFVTKITENVVSLEDLVFSVLNLTSQTTTRVAFFSIISFVYLVLLGVLGISSPPHSRYPFRLCFHLHHILCSFFNYFETNFFPNNFLYNLLRLYSADMSIYFLQTPK